MAIQIKQLGLESILYYRFTGDVTLNDINALAVDEAPYFAALPPDQCFGLIIDMTDLYTIVADLFPWLPHLRIVQDERICVAVVVGANPYLRALVISLGLTFSTRNFIFRDTLDEAINVLTTSSDPHLKPAGT